MPKILSYTPTWLSRPSPGSRIFSDAAPPSPYSPSKSSSYVQNGDVNHEAYKGRRRLIARRGTEIFAAIGNKIRWADLAAVKDEWEDQAGSSKGSGRESTDRTEPVLSAPIYQPIRQLLISPSEFFLAVLTDHTIHIAILPDRSRLADPDRSPLKLKSYQLGPTTHVIPQSPLVSALWHPLAVASDSQDCLVTVTAEAAVRVWELNRKNNWSFDRPALAIDLKKLVDGVSCDDDFEPSAFGKSKGFSADLFDMEASSACFGGLGLDEEDGWAPMTLWIAMRNGDIYALCPLLPSLWRPSSTLIPSLSTSVVARVASSHGDDLKPDERRTVEQQYEWVLGIDDEEPLPASPEAMDGDSWGEIRHRPSNPSAVPRLQGPFDVDIQVKQEDDEVSDIHAIAARLDVEELLSNEEDDYTEIADAAHGNLSATIICLATTTGQVHVLLDVEGVSGQWLPKAGRGTFSVPVSESRELILAESMSTDAARSSSASVQWPVFSMDVTSRYDIFLTSSKQIVSISFADWASRLDEELSSADTGAAGLETRLRVACRESVGLVEEVLNIRREVEDTSAELSAPVVLGDAILGHMLLTSTASRPYAVSFDLPGVLAAPQPHPQSEKLPLPTPPNHELVLAANPTHDVVPLPRAPYAPPTIFYEPPIQPLKHFLMANVPQRQKMTLKQEIRLSPATLDVMTSAHRIISSQTSQLEKAAAELFRRVDRLREELNDKVKQMIELASRLQHIGRGNEEGGAARGDYTIRLELAKARQRELIGRYENLRKKVGRATAGGKELSLKEVGWVNEINSLGETAGLDPGVDKKEDQAMFGQRLDVRYNTIKELCAELLAEVRSLGEGQKDSNEAKPPEVHGLQIRSSSASQRMMFQANERYSLVPSKLQKEKIAEAMVMVEREAAVIDAAMAKLDRLNLGG